MIEIFQYGYREKEHNFWTKSQSQTQQTRKWSRQLQEYRYMAEDLHSLTSDPTIRADLKKAIDDFRVKTEELNERLLKLEEMLKANPLTGPLAEDEEATEEKDE